MVVTAVTMVACVESVGVESGKGVFLQWKFDKVAMVIIMKLTMMQINAGDSQLLAESKKLLQASSENETDTEVENRFKHNENPWMNLEAKLMYCGRLLRILPPEERERQQETEM